MIGSIDDRIEPIFFRHDNFLEENPIKKEVTFTRFTKDRPYAEIQAGGDGGTSVLSV